MDRRSFISSVAVTVLAAPLAAAAEHARTAARIGVLFSESLTPAGAPIWEVFRNALRDLGWVEGQNLVIEWRFAEGKIERLPALAAELVRLKVDILVATEAPSSLAAKQATSTIPIVSVYTLDPVALGLVASLARPGGNITGISGQALEYTGKMLELLKQVVPHSSRVAVLGNPLIPSYPIYWQELDVAARTLRVALQPAKVSRVEELESVFAAIIKGQAPDALLVMHQPFTFHYRERIVDLAARNRLPAVYGSRECAEAGGLMGYGASLRDVLQRAATFVDGILKGAKPADLPVEQPTKFELVINLKTAKALGLTIPQSLLLRADELIQ